MSAKYTKKKTNGKRVTLWVIIVLLAVVLIAAVLLAWGLYKTEEPEPVQTEPSAPIETVPPATQSMVDEILLETDVFSPIELDRGLLITDIGKYTGVYMEDGTDELVSGVLMLVVKNTGEETIQYAEISLPSNGGEAKFTLSTLPAGESCVLLEQSRMEYNGFEDVSMAEATSVAVFFEPLSLQEDKLQLQTLDGALNIVNVSGQDITGDVVIYYKNAASDLLYGGITYRIRIEGGIKADEIKQVMAAHFSDTGSRIMFVTVG